MRGFDKNRFLPALVIFDKDGTLIDFNFMWASWVTELAERLERAAHVALGARLYAAMGYDAGHHKVIAGSPLAAHSMADLNLLTRQVAEAGGLSAAEARRVTDAAWFVPDPVAMARPLADLRALFLSLRARGLQIGVATSDDRASTIATLRALQVSEMVGALVSADDGLPNKPAPDMLLRVCEELNVSPQTSVMVGDGVADMQAACAAGIGWRIGVLSGVTAREQLEPYADEILPNVGDLLRVWEQI